MAIARTTIRLWGKELVARSPLLQWGYAWVTELVSSIALLFGRHYFAAGWQLHAWKHLGAKRLGARRLAKAKRLIAHGYCPSGVPVSLDNNKFLRQFVQSHVAQDIRAHFSRIPLEHRVRLRYPRAEDSPERQGNLMILKPYDDRTGERGVICLKYNDAILQFPALFHLPRIAQEYMIVLEPSTWGYQDSLFLLYLGADLDAVVLAQSAQDLQFIQELESNLKAIRLGAGDWVDPDTFCSISKTHKTYDLVMVAAWDPLKRHQLLFKALRSLKLHHERILRVALVGYPLGWTRRHIERLMRHYGVESQCVLFESVRHGRVAEILSQSRVAVLLSRHEGANKSVYESMFCDVPVIVYKHHRGVNTAQITPRVGMLVDDAELENAIAFALDHPETFSPREWAMQHTGYQNATRILQEALRDLATRRKLPWTTAIVPKKNAPGLRYTQPGIYRQFEAEYKRLEKYLIRS